MKDIFKKEPNVYVQDDLDRRKQNKQTNKKKNRMWTYSKPYFSHLENGDYDTTHFIGWLWELPNA